MQKHYESLAAFFRRDVCQRATKPLRDGIVIAVAVDGEAPLSLTKMGGRMEVTMEKPAKPDMSFSLTAKGLEQLSSLQTEDIGEIGVGILKLMAHSDPAYRMTAKVHIGMFDLLRHGYLGVLPLGGPTVMKFLGAKGFGSIGKIKDALSRLRSQG